MPNRFLEMDLYLKQPAKKGRARGLGMASSLSWSQPFSASSRVLVILIENGGIDLGIPAFVDKLMSVIPGAGVIPDSIRQTIISKIRDTLTGFTDNLIETAELAANRYTAAMPDLFGDVVVLRDGTASYQDIKNKLISLSRDGKIADLFILTHGTEDSIAVTGDINSAKIRAMKTELGKPLSLRSVYMMNCVGSSLNQAWLDAGAKTSCGTAGNNYLPEPTMYFFWQNWKDGQAFETAATSAYRKTVNMMKTAVEALFASLSFPFGQLVDSLVDFESLDFIKSSAPLIVGQRTVTISSDDLVFTQSVSSGLVTTVLPFSVVRSLSDLDAGAPPSMPSAISAAGVDLIKGFEGFIPKLYNDPAGHCTIGYGTLLHKGNCDGRASETPYADGVDEAKATQLLTEEGARFATVIQNNVKVSLNQNQFDALASFSYNIGEGAFRASTLLKVLNKGDYDSVPGEMKRWTKATKDGKVIELPGLVKRRAAEAALFQQAPASTSQSFSVGGAVQHSYKYKGVSHVVYQQSSYSTAQNPAATVVAGIEVVEAIQIGLGTVAIAQAQVSASQGAFSLTYDKAQRLLTNEARASMPGAQAARKSYSEKLLYLGFGRINTAEADIIIEWEGNPYGEIGTPVIRRNLPTSTEWSKSSANITITTIDRIPLPKTDPRTWPIVYSYEGTYDPFGNGYYEFSGEFEVNAFGGLKFNRHEVVSRSFLDLTIAGTPEGKVRMGPGAVVLVPDIPKEQLDYLRIRLP